MASLFPLVEDYHRLGYHRTGSDVDEATQAWMADQLADRGLDVGTQLVHYPGWSGESELTVGGEALEHLLVPYEWEGSLDTADVVAASFDPQLGGTPDVLDRAISDHRNGDRPLLLATEHVHGELVGVNRHELARGSGVPTVLCAGRDVQRITDGPVRLRVEARRRPATTVNLVASNRLRGRPLLLTTPLNGWFGCAGERGTGVAVLLDLVARVEDMPIVVVATAGHELGWFGVSDYIASSAPDPAAIVHLGASLAVPDAFRLARTSVAGEAAADLATALEPIGLDLQSAADRWVGEATAWSSVPSPLLSFTGAGVDFHTPADTPARATSPAFLDAVAAAVGDAVFTLYASTHQPTHP